MTTTTTKRAEAGSVKEPPNATDLIGIIEDLTLHGMTRNESVRLHELLDDVRIRIEETWARWDD